MASLDFKEWVENLILNPIGGVILSAGKIYHFVMKSGGSSNMLVPKMGVSDGIINQLTLKYM